MQNVLNTLRVLGEVATRQPAGRMADESRLAYGALVREAAAAVGAALGGAREWTASRRDVAESFFRASLDVAHEPPSCCY
jgi:hypothetical protein